MARRTPISRFAALLSLAAFLLGLFAAELHLVLEPHRYCAVHEAVEHVGDHGSDHADFQHEEDESEAASAIRLAQESPQSEHGECHLVTLTNEVVPPFGDAPIGLPVDVSERPVVERRGAPRAESVPRYRLAPKQSPPAA